MNLPKSLIEVLGLPDPLAEGTRELLNNLSNDSSIGAGNLPPRGTGLRRGTAGSRRRGNPRTDEERRERHNRLYGNEPY